MADESVVRPTRNSAFDLRIDELVLHGLRPTDRYQFAEAFERELTRLFHESGAPSALVDGAGSMTAFSAGRIDGGSFVVPHDASPAAVGTQAARAIHRSFASAGPARERAAPKPAQTPRGSGR